MDVRKHMLAYFEKTISSHKPSPRRDLSKQSTNSKTIICKSRQSPSPQKNSKSESLTTKSESVSRSLSSKFSSTRSSRISSPAPYSKHPSSQFRESVLKTINDLIKLRSFKISKNLEIVSKEVKLMKKLKVLIQDEMTLLKKHEEKRLIQDINERLSVIMKESAEELLILEQRVKTIIEENLNLQQKLEKILNPKKKPVLNVQSCLNDLTQKIGDVSTMHVSEPQRVSGYLADIDSLAQQIIKDLNCKDLRSLPGVLSLQLSREKMLFEQRKKQLVEDLQKNIKEKSNLEARVQGIEKSYELI